jgi:hypothetical protein
MSKHLSTLRNVRALLFLFLLSCTSTLVLAQQPKLKTQAAKSKSTIFGHNNVRKLSSVYDKEVAGNGGKPTAVADNAQLRRLYEIELMQDPATGKIPEGIREKELAFAERIRKSQGNIAGRVANDVIEDWRPRGPFNVGGRTRALA